MHGTTKAIATQDDMNANSIVTPEQDGYDEANRAFNISSIAGYSVIRYTEIAEDEKNRIGFLSDSWMLILAKNRNTNVDITML